MSPQNTKIHTTPAYPSSSLKIFFYIVLLFSGLSLQAFAQLPPDNGIYPYTCKAAGINNFYECSMDDPILTDNLSDSICIMQMTLCGSETHIAFLVLNIINDSDKNLVSLCNQASSQPSGYSENIPIELTLSNGETLTCHKNYFLDTRKDNIKHNDILSSCHINLYFNNMSSNFEMLDNTENREREYYIAQQLRTYNIKYIEIDGNRFYFKNFQTAATLDAMFDTLNEKTGKTYAMKSRSETEYDAIQTPTEQAEFPGGAMAMMQYLADNVSYPPTAQENGIQGRVLVTFIVGTDGTITEPEIIKSLEASLDREAIRVVRNMPKWKPAKLNGKPVSTSYTIPIVFKLQ